VYPAAHEEPSQELELLVWRPPFADFDVTVSPGENTFEVALGQPMQLKVVLNDKYGNHVLFKDDY